MSPEGSLALGLIGRARPNGVLASSQGLSASDTPGIVSISCPLLPRYSGGEGLGMRA